MVEVDVLTEGGQMGRGSAPTGTSVGMYESVVLRDGEGGSYGGLSVYKAVEVVTKQIAPALIGMDVCDQRAIDEAMIALDGTADKSRLGGNSTYSVSVACLRAAAAAHEMSVYRYVAGRDIEAVPMPTSNLINGGHNGAVTQAFNEFILAPYRAGSVEEVVEIEVSVYKRLEQLISRYSGLPKPPVGGSFGWAAPSSDPAQVLDLMAQAAEDCGYTGKVAFCLDCASSEMYDPDSKTYELKGKRVCADELIDFVRELSEKFDLLFVEDLLDENDWEGFQRAHKVITRTNLMGDDFTATNPERLRRACEMDCIDGLILKPNQIGTLTEAFDVRQFAVDRGLLVIPSGRAGGVVGDIIADLSIGLGCAIAKNGAPKSGERIDKLNTLLRASSENPGCRLQDLNQFVRFR